MPQNQPQNRFIEDHRDEILRLAEPALKVAEHTPFQGSMNGFDMTEEQYKRFITGFIKTVVEDKQLQAKMLEHFDQFELRTWNGDIEPDPKGSVGPEVDSNGQISKINRIAYIGKQKDNGLIETSFKTIRVGLHELFHSVSAKHDIQKANHAIANGENVMRDSSLGEVESMFCEQLFNEWLSDDNKIDKLRKNGVPFFGLSNGEVKKNARILKTSDLDTFVNFSNNVLDENLIFEKNNNAYWYRYTKGFVVASTAMQEYRKNAKKTIKHLGTFLEFGNEMDANQAISVFYGKYKKGAHHKKYNFDYAQELFINNQEKEYQKVKNYPAKGSPRAELIRSNMPQVQELDDEALNEYRETHEEKAPESQNAHNKQQNINGQVKTGQNDQQERQNG